MERQIRNELTAQRFIQDVIADAKEEVLVSSSWFINDDLLRKLLDISKQGINVYVISESDYWEKKLQDIALPQSFNVLSKLNSEDKNLDNNYCYVIDRKIVVYSIEKKTYENYNPFDNVVITKDTEVLQESLKKFKINNNKQKSLMPMQRFLLWLKQLFMKTEEVNHLSEVENNEVYTSSGGFNVEDRVFELLITTSIEDFDKSEVIEIGIESAACVKGNPASLYRTMDTVYSAFVNNVNKHLQEKANIQTKIDIAVEDFSEKKKKESSRNIAIKREEGLAKEQEYKEEINNCENQIEQIRYSIEKLEQKIPEKEEEFKKTEQKKYNLSIENIPETEINVVVKRTSLFIYGLITIGLLSTVFLFYASASYILLYAKQDAISGTGIPNLVDLDFYYKAFSRQGWVVAYILIFCFIPIGLAWFASSAKKTWRKFLGHSAVVLLDTLVAFNVQNNLNEIKALKGLQVSMFGIEQVLELIMIFFLGFVPLTLLITVINRSRITYKQNTYNKSLEEFKLQEAKINQDIIYLSHELSNFENERYGLNQQIIKLKGLIKELEIQLIYIPVKEKQYEGVIEEELEQYILSVKNKSKLYKNGINNNTVYLPVVALKARISVFLEGWKKWLYEQYSEQIASDLLKKAEEIVNTWLENNVNIPTENIVKMINLENNES